MAQGSRFFPGLREPLTCAGLLLALGLYTAALLLPAFEGPSFDLHFHLSSKELQSGGDAVLSAPMRWAKDFVDGSQGRRSTSDKDIVFYWGLMARAWLPNVLFWLGLFCLAAGRGHPAWIAGAFGLYEGVFFASVSLATDTTLLAGYYVWLASMAVLIVLGGLRALWPRVQARIGS
jgi:hypothetical protein